MCLVDVLVKDYVSEAIMTWVCSDIVQIQCLLRAIKTFRHALLQNMGGGDISVIRQFKKKNATFASHFSLPQQRRSHYHATEIYGFSSPLGAQGLQVLGQKEGKMAGRWDWYVPPP